MLFLTLETFRGTGGVQMVCRSMAKALAELSTCQDPFEMISLCDNPEDLNQTYLPAGMSRAFSYRRLAFVRYVLGKAKVSRTVILAHVNLIGLAWLIKLMVPEARIILLAHGKEVWRRSPFWKRRFIATQIQVWAVSRYTRMKLIEQQDMPATRISVLHNCLDPLFTIPHCFSKPSALLECYGLHAGQEILLTICRMGHYEQNKGYDLVLEALPEIILQFPRLVYLLAGTASLKEQDRLRRKIRGLGLEPHVIFTGFISDEVLCDHHLLADVFVLPSSKEGFGLVFIEAAVCGRKIIAGNKDGSVDAVLDGKLATLVDPTSKKELTTAIISALKQDKDDAHAKAQQLLALHHFSFDNYKSNIKQLLALRPNL